jgi:hypothetical protein
MDSIKDQNDWAEFRSHLNREMDKQVTSNKALLWVSIGGLCLFNIITLCVALVSLMNTMVLKQEIKSLTVMYSTMEVQYKCLYATVFKDVK